MNLQTLPYIDFQHDALAVFDDVSQGVVEQEDIWVSCYQAGKTSVHGKAKIRKGDKPNDVDVLSREGVEVSRTSRRAFTVSSPSLAIISTTVRFPRLVIQPERDRALTSPLSINTLNVSPDASQIVYGGPDGYCRVESAFDPPPGTKRMPALQLKGHVGDVLCARWFPSGKVVLTAASDTLLRIFSSEDGSNPRTLKGHKRAVTDTRILGVGRNVLSSSKDGSIRLWDVGEGKCVTSMYSEGFNGVERLATGAKQACGSPTANVDEESKTLAGESVTDTQDKVVYAALSSGSFGAYDLSSKRPIFGAIPHLPSVDSKFPASLRGGPIHALAHDGEHLLASGSSKGIIVVRDTRMLSSAGDQALAVFRRNEAAINDLAWVSSSGSTQADLAIATASGLPCRVGLDSSKQDGNVKIVEEYAGWEPVPIETVAIASDGGVWFAGGEGGIRRY